MTPTRETLTVIILTRDEERHIGRALKAVEPFADRCVVVDSGSRDKTVEIAQAQGATVLQNAWVNYATQFNWALENLPEPTDWVFRLDADEIVPPELGAEIKEAVADAPDGLAGFFVGRRIAFQRRPIRWGGVFPIRVLRLFRYGQGRCENRWMDEHVLVDGGTRDLTGEILDDNLNPLGWWIDKHNGYAAREAIDLLNLKHQFMAQETVAKLDWRNQAGTKRWIKERVYARLPSGFRASAYFIYRFVFRLGFLDGAEGRSFHFLQGFWYRYLVDRKLREVERQMHRTGSGPVPAIRAVLGIDVATKVNAACQSDISPL